MKENFDACLDQVLEFEGGFVDNPHDPGGRTNYGITQHEYSMYLAKEGEESADVKDIDMEVVAKIYRTYWDGVGGDYLPAGVDLAMFDFAVNSGTREALMAWKHSAHSVDALCAFRLHYLKHLSTWQDFGRGWAHRVETVQIVGREMAAGKKQLRPRPI